MNETPRVTDPGFDDRVIGHLFTFGPGTDSAARRQVDGSPIPEHSCSCGGLSGTNYSEIDATRLFVAHVLASAARAIKHVSNAQAVFVTETDGSVVDLVRWATVLRNEAYR